MLILRPPGPTAPHVSLPLDRDRVGTAEVAEIGLVVAAVDVDVHIQVDLDHWWW